MKRDVPGGCCPFSPFPGAFLQPFAESHSGTSCRLMVNAFADGAGRFRILVRVESALAFYPGLQRHRREATQQVGASR